MTDSVLDVNGKEDRRLDRAATRQEKEAVGVGFEPTVNTRPTPVFKTGPFSRSGTPPGVVGVTSILWLTRRARHRRCSVLMQPMTLQSRFTCRRRLDHRCAWRWHN
jgi:hypothetical protein